MKFKDSIYANSTFFEHSFEFGTIYLLSNIIVAEFKEGILLTYDNAIEFKNTVNSFYENEDNVYYISNRINSYAVNPIALS